MSTDVKPTAHAPRLASEDVIINSPMSFAGSAQRAFRMKRDMVGALPTRYAQIPAQIPAVLGVLIVIVLWWAVIVVWYAVFGLLLVPYRLLRRGARKRKREALQHREMMAAIEARNQTPDPPVGV